MKQEILHTEVLRLFLQLIMKYQPKYFLHGHTHMNYVYNSKRITEVGKTKVINCSGIILLELEE